MSAESYKPSENCEIDLPPALPPEGNAPEMDLDLYDTSDDFTENARQWNSRNDRAFEAQLSIAGLHRRRLPHNKHRPLRNRY